MLAPQNGIELRSKRTVNSKHYDMGGGQTLAHFGVGHQHYENKNLVGDGEGGWRSLDWTLTEKEGGGWTFLYHSFNPDIPQYADGWLSFRDLFESKDQTIGFKPVCSHVEGRLVASIEGLTDINAVIYDDAFGTGIDCIVYFTRSTMKKCARIRNDSKENKDYSFKWQVEFPHGSEVWRKGETEYRLEMTGSKEMDTAKMTELRTSNGTTYFKPFLVWDSGEGMDYHQETCKVTFSVEDGKTFLTKHIPQSFMEKSIGDVFTDTTTSYYVGAGDGAACYNTSSTYSTTHNASTGSLTATVSDYSGSGKSVGNFYIWRAFLPISTSNIPDDATILSASMFLNLDSTSSYEAAVKDGDDWYSIVKTFQASTSSLVNADYEDCGSDNNSEARAKYVPIYGSANIDVDTLATGYNNFALNSTGISWISTTGYTKLGIREGHDCKSSGGGMANGDDGRLDFSSSAATGQSKDPYLSVTYSETKKKTRSPGGGAAYSGGGSMY